MPLNILHTGQAPMTKINPAPKVKSAELEKLPQCDCCPVSSQCFLSFLCIEITWSFKKYNLPDQNLRMRSPGICYFLGFLGDLDALCMMERDRFMINGDLLFHRINIDNQ